MAGGPAPSDRLLVVLPTWVGDIAMATPTLAALRSLWPDAHLACLVRAAAAPVIDAAPWCDQLLTCDDGDTRAAIALIREGRFDTAVLLPNSFRSALRVWRARVPRRVGYRRDWRGLLLTDRIEPPRHAGRFAPVPTIDYYLALARHLGSPAADRTMRLYTREADDAAARAKLTAALADRPAPGTPVVLLNPGAATKGAAKLWPADRFAALADRLIADRRCAVLLNGAPTERPILEAVHAAARHELIDLQSLGSNLRLLKSYIKLAQLVVTNDTGPRHLAAALGTPVVSLFGPTDPAWTALDIPHERIIRSPDATMPAISVDTVYDAACSLLALNPQSATPGIRNPHGTSE